MFGHVRWWAGAIVVVSLIAGCGESSEEFAPPTETAVRTTSTAPSDAADVATGPAPVTRLGPDEMSLISASDAPADVEQVLSFAVGGDPSGCPESRAQELEGVYFRHSGPIDGGEVGWPLLFCLGDTDVTMTVVDPDGATEVIEGIDDELLFDTTPRDPEGSWSFSAAFSDGVVLDTEVDFHSATEGRIYPLDVEAAYSAGSGDVVAYGLVGFAPSDMVEVGVYRLRPDGVSSEFVTLLSAPTDDTGAAILELEISDDDAPGIYTLMADPRSEESKASAQLIPNDLEADLFIE